MQTISQNPITQGKHGQYNAVDISPSPDPDYYAPEDGTITSWGDSGTCGLRLELLGATGRHGFCHNEKTYVSVGQTVKRGQKLARMGYTGYTQPDNVPAGTHVHWVILRNGVYVYPPSLVNQGFIKLGGDVIGSEDIAPMRIVMSEVEGWNGRKVHAGDYDKIIADAWVGKPWEAFITNGWVKQKTHRYMLEDKIAVLNKTVSALNAKIAAMENPTVLVKGIYEVK